MQRPLTTASEPLRPAATRQRDAQLEALIAANIDDLLGGIGLQGVRRGRRLLDRLFYGAARRFAEQVMAYDDAVGTGGLSAGGRWAIEHFVERLEIVGAELVPRTGPLLILSNHPGLCDTTALFTAIPRTDLRIVAADRPFLRALPHTSRYLLYVDERVASRLTAIRAVARQLRAGGAVLTFPGGQIEPDPAVLPGAAEAIDSWSASIEVLARLSAEVTIVPAIVSGVISPAALRHPLTYLRRRPKDRHWLAALLQIQRPALGRVAVRVAFGRPIRAQEGPNADARTLREAVKAEARRLIAAAPQPAAVSA